IRAGKGRGQKEGNALPLAYIAPKICIPIRACRYDKKQVCRVRDVGLLSVTLAITSDTLKKERKVSSDTEGIHPLLQGLYPSCPVVNHIQLFLQCGYMLAYLF